MKTINDPVVRFFSRVIRARWLILSSVLMLTVGLASQLGKLQKNTQADAFIREDAPVLRYRDLVEDIFNLKDPIVVAIINASEQGIYNAQTLELVSWLTQELRAVENIDPDGITSLATESSIEGDSAGMRVEKFLDGPLTSEHIRWIRASIDNFPLYRGKLVARDGSATLIAAELLDRENAEQTYQKVMDLVRKAPAGPHDAIHVAGEGAVSGYLSAYIDADARRLNPLAGVIITLILIAAFRTLRGAVIPNLVVGGTVAITLGAMASLGVEFFVITNGLIVCMIGIAVADSIHIFSEYYALREAQPDAENAELVATAMADVWKPVTLTTLTTAAGFLSLYPTNDMPPMQYFGLFGALAVLAAWGITLLVTPSLLSFLKPQASRCFDRSKQADSSDMPLVRVLEWLSLKRPGITVCVGLLIACAAVLPAQRVQVNEQRIENFNHDEPIYIADQVINQHLDGSYYLDVVIHSDQESGIYEPATLQKIEKLQSFLESHPAVHGTTSIADYIKQMHKAVNEANAGAYRIPDDKNLIAQLFLLYSSSGDPTDFEQTIDSARQTTLVRAHLKSATFSINRQLIPSLNRYLEDEFDGQLTAHPSGRIHVDYHWISGIADQHLASVAVSFLAVVLMASVLFRSLAGGVMASLPVGLAILVIYAVMGARGIWLGVGTSMFAAIAIGLSVDFAIHTLERLRTALTADGVDTFETRVRAVFASTGRALWFNLLAVGLGFGVLMTSQVPPLVNFGMLVALAVSVAFVASVVLLPALAWVFRPTFLFAESSGLKRTLLHLLVLLAALATAKFASADTPPGWPAAEDVVYAMNHRAEGQQVRRDMIITLTDRRGHKREERTIAFRRWFGETKKTVIYYRAPAAVEGTAFLTWDYPDANREDDQWLYLPALRKVRRISASDRGDFFLGTDFTYEEIKKESKLAAEDYEFRMLGEETVDGHHTWVIEAKPRTAALADDLGYSRVRLRVDSRVHIPRLSDYWDVAGNFLKTVHAREIREISGIWTVVDFRATNHKSGHQTRIQFENTDYHADVPARLFQQNALKRGY